MNHGWQKQPIRKGKSKPQVRKDREAEQKELIAATHAQLKKDCLRRQKERAA